MQWRNIRLIFLREIRDQLRDRRTLFMIAVLPLVLYPLLGMSVFQLAQFLRENEPNVLVIGSEQLAGGRDLPALIRDGRFAEELFSEPAAAEQLNLEFFDGSSAAGIHMAEAAGKASPNGLDTRSAETSGSAGVQAETPQSRLKTGDVQVVLYFPSDFGQRLLDLRALIQRPAAGPASGNGEAPSESANSEPIDIPEPELFFNSGKDKSRIAHMQVERVLNAWKTQIIRENLQASRVPVNVARPFEVKPRDIAEPYQQQALLWSKVLPFVLFIWALTGAFYPAVDLCAGEKERGTLETLLSSPALRTEIVWGKLLTVMVFSGMSFRSCG
jgi:sodium transport system permease protein